MFVKRTYLVVWVSLGGSAFLLASCGGTSDSDDNATRATTTTSNDGGSDGTRSTSSGQGAGSVTSSGGSSVVTSTATSGGAGGTNGTAPRQPVDPFPNDNPRTEGDRVKPGERVDCPDVEPAAGEECEKDGLDCSYGDSAVWKCRRKYTCDSHWARVGEDCEALPENYCTAEPSPGVACTPAPSAIGPIAPTCEFESMICYCPTCDRFQPCDGDGTREWICISPPADLDCPLLPPNIGEGCTEQAKHCVYGDTCLGNGVGVFCRGGVWEEMPGGCDD